MGANRGIPGLPAPRVFKTDDERLKYDTRIYESIASMSTELGGTPDEVFFASSEGELDQDSSFKFTQYSANVRVLDVPRIRLQESDGSGGSAPITFDRYSALIGLASGSTITQSCMENWDPWIYYSDFVPHTGSSLAATPNRYQFMGLYPDRLGVRGGRVPFGVLSDDDNERGVCTTSSRLVFNDSDDTGADALSAPRIFLSATAGIDDDGEAASPPIQFEDTDADLSAAVAGSPEPYPLIPDPELTEFTCCLETDGGALYWTDATTTRRAIAMHDSAATGGPVTGAGAAGYVAIWNGISDLTYDTSPLYFDRTNNRLGIGTTSFPQKDFHILGDAPTIRLESNHGSGFFAGNDVTALLEFKGSGDPGVAASVGVNADDWLDITSSYHVQLRSESGNYALCLTTSGHVAIGYGDYAIPDTRLKVYDQTADTQRIAWFDGAVNASQRHYISVFSTNDTAAAGRGEVILGTLYNSRSFVGSKSSTDFMLYAGDTEQVRITQNGRVLIGCTTDATFDLRVDGHTGPHADDTWDLGSTTGPLRWRHLYMSGFFHRSTTAGITASTTQTQGQGALTSELNEISTCANANDTVTLPAAVAGRFCLVINNGAQTAQVFPASGDNLGAGADASTTITAGSRKLFAAFDATNWEPVI